MKKFGLISSVLLIAFTLFSFAGGGEYQTLEIGSKAPITDKKMASTDDASYSLEDLSKANGMLVIFSCNTCPFVIAWENRYPDIREWAEQAEVGFTLINSNEAKRDNEDSMANMKLHSEEKGYPGLPYLVDVKSELANAFGAKTTPHVFLFDSNWKLVYEGAIDDNFKDKDQVQAKYLHDALHNLKNGQVIDPNNTKAMGCSIKRVKS